MLSYRYGPYRMILWVIPYEPSYMKQSIWTMLYGHINYIINNIIYNLFDIIQFICTISCQPIYIDFIWSISYVPFHMMHLVRDKIHSWFDRLQSFWKAWKVFLNHFESIQHSSIQLRKFLRFIGHESFMLTSVVTDVGDEMYWWQL